MKKYEDLYNSIKTKIETNEYKSGDKIPSVRKASEIYNVSITTVQNAYFELCADGYIASIDKSGYYVTGREMKSSSEISIKEEAKIKYDFTGGIADEDGFNISLWHRYIKSALRQKERLLTYSQPQGELDLREEIAKYIYKKRNIITSPDKIVIGAGVAPLTQILCSLIDEKSTVSFPDSSFKRGMSIFKDYGFDVHTRYKDAKIIYVSPSHMTSWGDVMPIKRRLELIDYSIKNNSLVIEDDYENEFLYNTKPTPSLFTLGKENIVYIGSFSAMLLPGIRISFMVLTSELANKFKLKEDIFAQTASMTEQIALCNYIRDGHIYSQTKKIRRLYTAKTKHLYSIIKAKYPDLDVTISENSLQLIIKTNKPHSQIEFEKLGIKVYMPSDKTIVLSPAGVKEEYYEEIIDKIKVNIL